jgi:hypothetical protein
MAIGRIEATLLIPAAVIAACQSEGGQGGRPAFARETSPTAVQAESGTEEAVLGATLRRKRDSSGPATAAVRDDMSIYGRLNLKVNILSPGFSRVARLNDGSVLDRLWRALVREVAPTARHFALTVTPMQGDVSLGELVILTIDQVDQNTRDGGVGPQLESSFQELTDSPWVRLDPATGLSYRVTARATTATGIDVKRELGNAIAVLAAIGAGPTSGISSVVGFGTQKVVGDLASRGSGILNGAFSSEPKSSAMLTLGPTAQAGPGRFWRQDRIVVQNDRGEDLAVLTVNLFMTATLAAPDLRTEVPPEQAALAKTRGRLVSRLPVPRDNTTRVETLDQQLPRHPPLDEFARATRTPSDAVSYRQRCLQAQSYAAGQLGLTEIDALRVRFEIADENGYNANAALRGSGCFSEDEVRALEAMGYQPLRDTAVPRAAGVLTNEEMEKNVIPILLGAGGSTDRFNQQLSPRVAITAPAGVLGDNEIDLSDELAVDRGDVVNQFLRGRASFAGCFGVPSGETPNSQRLDRRVFLLPKDVSLGPMVMRLVVGGDGRAIEVIEVRRASERLIQAACATTPDSRNRLLAALRVATPPRTNLVTR